MNRRPDGEGGGNLAILSVVVRGQEDFKDEAVIGLEEALKIFHRFRSLKPSRKARKGAAPSLTDDSLSDALGIAFRRSKADYLEINDEIFGLGSRDIWLTMSVSIADVPKILRPILGVGGFEFRHSSVADVERRIRWFFTLPGKQVCDMVRKDEVDRSFHPLVFRMKQVAWWIGLVVVAIMVLKPTMEAWAMNDLARMTSNLKGLLVVLGLLAFWFLLNYLWNMKNQAPRCWNCGNVVIDDRLRPDGCCNHCRVPIPHERIESPEGLSGL